MTSPSSHVFYSTMTISDKRREGTMLNRVFITENTITLYSKEVVRTAKSGVLFEKIKHQTTYSLNENSRGVKYLKRYSKSAGGNFTDSSLEAVMSGGIYNNVLISNTANYACRVLIEKTILNWFDIKFEERTIESHKAKLLFPAMRDEGFPRDETLAKTLSIMQKMTSSVTKALRENNSWDAFIMDICNSVSRTSEDVSVIKQHPNELLPIAGMKVPSLSSLYAEDKETLLKLAVSFSPLDLNLIHFMFKNLPSEDRPEALKTVLFLVKKSTPCLLARRQSNTQSTRRYNQANSAVPASRVPLKLRPILAQKLLDSLVETSNNTITAFKDFNLVLALSHVFRYWFAQEVMEPKLKTETTREDIESRFLELFGIPLKDNSAWVKFYEKKGLVFCSIHSAYTRGRVSRYHEDLFSSLSSLVIKKRPKDKGTSAGYSRLNGFIRDDRTFITISDGLYSLDDLMEVIEAGAVATDENLVKLGRKITPANRAAFLTLGSKERKFKNTWKYYDWGVTDPMKILALKKGRITKKNEVQTFNALPDEMFNEFLSMVSGEELTSVGY